MLAKLENKSNPKWLKNIKISKIFCQNSLFIIFAAPINILLLEIVRWCNWQHVWFWSRRVQVRDLIGQQ